MRIKKLLAFACALGVVLTLVLATTGFAQEKGHLRVAWGYKSVRGFDPAYENEGNAKLVQTSLFNALVRHKPGRVGVEYMEPDLAESWSVGEDQKTWTFNLRRGVKFHKGYGEFTAEDVKYHIDRVKNPENKSRWRSIFDPIESAKVVDKYTVQIKTKYPDPVFLWRVVNYHQGYIPSSKAIEDLGQKKHRLNPVGTGPFEFEEMKSKQWIKLRAFKDHFRGRPKLDRMTYFFIPDATARELAFQNKEIDSYRLRGVLPKLIPKHQKLGKVHVMGKGTAGGSSYMLFLNRRRKELQDIRVRRALMHGLNREAFVKAEYGNAALVHNSAIPVGSFGYTLDGLRKYEYDVAKAKRLLKEAGYPNGFDLGNTFVHATTSKEIYEFIKAEWRKLGVNINLKLVPGSTYHTNARKHLSPILIYGYARIPDADVWLKLYFYGGNPRQNFGNYTKMDAKIDEAGSTLDQKKRLRLYKEIGQQLMEDLPAIPFVIWGTVYANQNYVDLGYDPVSTMIYGLDFNEMVSVR
jgi:peptide/nickel transport system substrate-binding protein